MPEQWRRALVSDNYVRATPEQMRDLGGRIEALVQEWTQDCRDDLAAHPDAERRPVRFVGRVFPSDPVRR